MSIIDRLQHPRPKQKFVENPISKALVGAARQLEYPAHLPKRTKAKHIPKHAKAMPYAPRGKPTHGNGTAYKAIIINAPNSRAHRKVAAHAALADATGTNRPAPRPMPKNATPAMRSPYAGDGRLERPAPKRRRRHAGSGFAGSGGGNY